MRKTILAVAVALAMVTPSISVSANEGISKDYTNVVIIEEPTVEETPVEEPTVEETTVEETPVEEPTVEEPIVEEPTVEETPVEKSPVVEEPVVEETPVATIETSKEVTVVVEETPATTEKTTENTKTDAATEATSTKPAITTTTTTTTTTTEVTTSDDAASTDAENDVEETPSVVYVAAPTAATTVATTATSEASLEAPSVARVVTTSVAATSSATRDTEGTTENSVLGAIRTSAVSVDDNLIDSGESETGAVPFALTLLFITLLSLLFLFLFGRKYQVIKRYTDEDGAEKEVLKKFFSIEKACEYVRDYEWDNEEDEYDALNIINTSRTGEYDDEEGNHIVEELVYYVSKDQDVQGIHYANEREVEAVEKILGFKEVVA